MSDITREDRTTIIIAHSPDSDDAFMHYAIGEGKVDPGRFHFDHFLSDIETLNRAAVTGTYEVSAISIHGYAHLRDRYALLNHGASMGEGYGPVVVSKEGGDRNSLEGKTVAIPGEWTSAALALRLWNPGVKTCVIPFDEIIPAVLEGKADAGVVIHEGQLTYNDEGLERIVDLGVWWAEEEDGLPLPLGGNAIRRDLAIKTSDCGADQTVAEPEGSCSEAVSYPCVRTGVVAVVFTNHFHAFCSKHGRQPMCVSYVL